MSESNAPKTFDPGRYLTKVGASDYLEVKWRLVWLREVHPEARIETKLLAHTENSAVVWACITIPDGGSACGIGSETYDDFRDFMEKAETKAIGRACAALGFGTQFCPDFDFGASAGAVVDSPIDFASTRGRRMAATGEGNQGAYNGPPPSAGQPATPRQLKFIQAIAREQGVSDEDMNAEVQQLYGRPLAQLDRRDASAYIERIQSRRPVTDLSS
jgi:hypothetical protein